MTDDMFPGELMPNHGNIPRTKKKKEHKTVKKLKSKKKARTKTKKIKLKTR